MASSNRHHWLPPVRDLWQRRDVGRFANGYTVSVPAHGTMLIKVGQPSSTD